MPGKYKPEVSVLSKKSSLELLAQIILNIKPNWSANILSGNLDDFSESDVNHILLYLKNVSHNLSLFIPATNPYWGISERGGDALLGYYKNAKDNGTYLFFADISGFTALLTFLTEKFGKEEAGDIMNLSILNRFCLNKMGLIVDHFKSENIDGDKGFSALKVILGIRAVMPLVTCEVKNELRQKLAGKPHQNEIESFVSQLDVKASGGLIFTQEPQSGFYGTKIHSRITWGNTGKMLALAEKIGGSDEKVAKDVEEVKGFATDGHCFSKLKELLETKWLNLLPSDLAVSGPSYSFRKIVIRSTGMKKIEPFIKEICSEEIKQEKYTINELSTLGLKEKKKNIFEFASQISEMEKYLGNRSLLLHIVHHLGSTGNNNILLDETASSIRNSGILFCNFQIQGPEILDPLVDKVHTVMNHYGIHYKYNIFPKGDFNLMGVLGTLFSEKRETDRYYSEILWHAWQDLIKVLKKDFDSEIKIRGGMSVGKALHGPAGDNLLHNEETIIGPDCNLAARLVNEALETDNKGDFIHPSGTLLTIENHRDKIIHLIQPLPPLRCARLKGFSNPIAIYKLIERHEVESIEEFITRLRKIPLITIDGKIVKDSHSLQQDIFLKKSRQIIEEVAQGKRNKAQLIAFVAQSGVGKTRRIAELAYLALCNHWPVFFGECYSWYQTHESGISNSTGKNEEQPEHHSDEGSYPFYPFIKILKEQIFKINNYDSPETKYAKIADTLSRIYPSDPEIVDQVPVIASFIGVNLPESKLSAALDAEARRNIFYERVGDIFAYEAAKAGANNVVLLCIDDLQWSDRNSLHLLTYLMRRVNKRLVVLLNARKISQLRIFLDENLPIDRLILKPGLLHVKAVERLAKLILGIDPQNPRIKLPTELKEKLEKGLEGNPFFVIEFCNKILEEEIVTVADGKCARFDEEKFKSLSIPTKIGGVIEDRIRRLTNEEHAAIQYSSVLGNILRYIIIRKFLPQVDHDKIFSKTNLEDIFNRLTGNEITRLENEKDPDWVYSFKRALIGEKLYQELVPTLRKRLHKEIAGIFEATDLANHFEKALLTALHYSNAEMPDKSCSFYLDAARLAKDVFDNERSLMLFDKIEKILADYRITEAHQRKMTLFEDRGQINLLIGRYTKALDDFNSLAKLALEEGNHEKTASANYLIGKTYFSRSLGGDYDKAIEYFIKAVAGTSNPRLLAEIQNDLARTHLEKGERDEALKLFDEAEISFSKAMTSESIIEDKIFQANLFRNRGSVFHRKGEFKKAIGIYNKALQLVSDESESRFKKIRAMLFNSIGLSLMKAFKLEDSLGYFKKALALSASIGDLRTEILIRNNMGVVYNDMGQNKKALKALTEQHGTLEALLGETRELAMLKFNIGESNMFMENYAEVEPWYRRALAIGEHIGYREFVVATRYNLAEFLHVQARAKEALAVLQPAFRMARDGGWDLQSMDISNLMGEIHREAGRFKRANMFHKNALELSDKLEDNFGRSWSLRNLALDVTENSKSGKESLYECGPMFEEALKLARSAGQPDNIMHCLRDLIQWKQKCSPEDEAIKELILELKKLAKKAGSKQFKSFCDSISSKG